MALVVCYTLVAVDAQGGWIQLPVRLLSEPYPELLFSKEKNESISNTVHLPTLTFHPTYVSEAWCAVMPALNCLSSYILFLRVFDLRSTSRAISALNERSVTASQVVVIEDQ